MHVQNTGIIGKIHRWKTVVSLITTGYCLLVYGAVSLEGWLKKRGREKSSKNA